jgi:hypothetical protein
VSHNLRTDLRKEEIGFMRKVERELINPAPSHTSRWLLGLPAGYEMIAKDSKIENMVMKLMRII